MSEFTESQLREMSDFEVNKAVMVMLGFELSNWLNNNYGHYKVEGTTCLACVKEYCKKPDDIIPLAFERKIGLQHFNRGMWQASCSGDAVYSDVNPLRAIACLILLIGK